MNKQTEELKMQLGDMIDGMRTKAINNVTIKSSTLERFADELNQFEIELHKALEQPQCNQHPKAPHGFNRDASHSADRYVCDCEGWDAWQDGYEEGLRKGLELEQPAQDGIELNPKDFIIESWSSKPSPWTNSYNGVKITHHKTGIVVTEDSERSQHKNKCIAIERLKVLLLEQPAQEPVAYDKLTNDEKASIKRQINDAFNEGFEKGKAMSLVASIPPNFIKLESIDKPAPQPAQEPVDVARVQLDGYVEWREGYEDLPVGTKLYTHPAPSWQGLDDDEKKQLHKEHHLYIPTIDKIEAMLKEKNI